MKTYKILSIALLLNISSSYVEADKGNSKDYLLPMNGMEAKQDDKANVYITAGDKTYIIGTQDGDFPDLGGHVQGEMGGVWNLPMKLLDGYWLRIKDMGDEVEWLKNASTFTTFPDRSEFVYPAVFGKYPVKQIQFCPEGRNGMAVEYVIGNLSDKKQTVKVDFVVKTDISPVWFSRENGIYDYIDQVDWDAEKSIFQGRDSLNNWFTVWGSDCPVSQIEQNAVSLIKTKGKGKSVSSSYTLDIEAGGTTTIRFVVTGSMKNFDDAVASFQDILGNIEKLQVEKKHKYEEILSVSAISIPDKKLEEAYNWIKVNTQWLVSDLSGYGRFLGAGAIEYPWLFGCDNSYAQQGVVRAFDPQLAESTLQLIKKRSEEVNANGRIIHEMSSNGFVGNKGNTQETAHYIVSVWEVFSWTGNYGFLREVYPYMKKGIQWLLTEQDKNGNMFPEGYGIMEVKGLNAELIDVAVYTQQALDRMAKISVLLGEPVNVSNNYKEKAEELKKRINQFFWDKEEQIYCDFYGSKQQALQTTLGALEQIKMMREQNKAIDTEKEQFYKHLYEKINQLPDETMKGWFTNKNWVISTPIEMGIAPKEHAFVQLDKVKQEHCGEYGPYLSAIEKLHQMTISTGVQAVSECVYGRVDNALWYMERIAATLNSVLPGSISEMMPDYGCPAQAWTIYGVAVPLISYIYMAYNQKLIRKL